jgi:cyclopropane fatty-acyl-phospholipid synthase-like methyltransferase
VDARDLPQEAHALARAIVSGAPVTREIVNGYYTLCIPFFREFLGDHWHTGFYDADKPAGPQDQLRMEQVVAESAGVRAGQAVLDVGCGVGGTARHLARLTGARIWGLTPNPRQLAIARAAACSPLDDRVAFDLGFADSLPYLDGSFDVVLFFESACHFPSREKFFAEAFRVLRPGGRLAGQDWVACLRVPPEARGPWVERVCSTWAIPALGTVTSYADGMSGAGFDVQLALDMREEMDLPRGFMTRPADRAAVEAEMLHTADPVRRLIMQGLVALGEAVQHDAFSVGRFLARKPIAE